LLYHHRHHPIAIVTSLSKRSCRPGFFGLTYKRHTFAQISVEWVCTLVAADISPRWDWRGKTTLTKSHRVHPTGVRMTDIFIVGANADGA
jgi:hypothetical protein